MGSIRIVAGALRGRRIRVPDRGVRPTSDRIREAVFDVLGPNVVAGARVLDLYAGTGALGIEALSRGARSADFVEGNPAVARALRENLASLALADRARVHHADLSGADLPAGAEGPYDLVFLDPPYAGDQGLRWLGRLARLSWPEGGGLIVYERKKGGAVSAPGAFTLAAERTYSETTVAFYRVGSEDAKRGGA
jgi:16S rRNA (guanine966-N2)-methyltransferase